MAWALGDCCSESWWADAVGVAQLLNAEIRAVEEIDLPTPDDERTRQEYDQCYGLRFRTNNGICDFVYRNSSNGYYGGWAEYRWAESFPDFEKDWQQIEKDWSA